VDQMYLEDPVPDTSQFVEIAHRLRILRRDPGQGLLAGNMRVRELADQMAGNFAAKYPASFVGALLRERIKLRTGDVGAGVKMSLHPIENDRQVGDQYPSGMPAEYIGTANVCLPVFEDRAEIDVDDVVVLDRANGWIIRRNRQCVGPR